MTRSEACDMLAALVPALDHLEDSTVCQGHTVAAVLLATLARAVLERREESLAIHTALWVSAVADEVRGVGHLESPLVEALLVHPAGDRLVVLQHRGGCVVGGPGATRQDTGERHDRGPLGERVEQVRRHEPDCATSKRAAGNECGPRPHLGSGSGQVACGSMVHGTSLSFPGADVAVDVGPGRPIVGRSATRLFRSRGAR